MIDQQSRKKKHTWARSNAVHRPRMESGPSGELSRGSHKSPDRVRNAKSRNITPVRRKLGRQEWNKTPGIRPSIPPFTKYIDALII